MPATAAPQSVFMTVLQRLFQSVHADASKLTQHQQFKHDLQAAIAVCKEYSRSSASAITSNAAWLILPYVQQQCVAR
jgi:hypothetical protein